jgi:hypothetical protein
MSGSKRGHISEEGREKLAELARQRHAEGKFGGAHFGRMGGRPRKDRAAKRIAEAAQEEQNAKALIAVFKDGVDERQPIGTRLQAAKLWTEIEREEARVSLQEERSDQDLGREELIASLTERLSKGPAARVIQERLIEQESGIVEATVVEEEDAA